MSWYTETETGLTYNDQAKTLSFEQYEAEWNGSASELSGKQWKVGDLMLFGEQKFGEKVAQVIDVRRVSRRRIANYTWVARKFSGRRRKWRRSKLSYSHHEAVAGLIDDPDHPEFTVRARELLEHAQTIGLSVQDLEDEVARLRGDTPLSDNPLAMIQQARNLCEEAEPLCKGDIRVLVRSARSTLEDAAGELSMNQEFEGVTQAWFPRDQDPA